MTLLKQLWLLTAKDLRIEARTRQTLGLIVVLGLLIVVVLGLGLGPEQLNQSLAAPAALWVAYLFGGVLCFEKTMAVERHDAALAGLLMAPVDRGVIYLAKLLSNLILMFALAAIVTPIAVTMLSFDLSPAPGGFAAVMALAMIGYAALGTLFSAPVSATRLKGGLLAVIVLPIALPLVIVSTQLLLAMFRDQVPLTGTGLAILLACDAIYLVVSWLLFELVLEP
ncbi:MAG: heme exporter protein CcmB [Phycisphaeraceae bacterium]|nr:heme exporter protein CcmB [Phycisphaeraceae bacterium]